MKSLLFGVACLTAVVGHAVAADKTNVNVAAPWEIASVDPAKSGYVFQRLEVMETLVDADLDGNLRPGLATMWTASNDGLTWIFTLRANVKFHDGSALDSEAAASALQRAMTQPGVLGKAPIAEIAAQDDSVVFSLKEPFAALPAFLANYSAVIPAPAAFDAAGRPVKAIGTGPFQVAEFSPPQSMAIARFDDYWGERATVDSANYLAVGRTETRALLAESGDADFVFTLDPSGFRRLGSVGSVETVAVPIPRVVTLKVNAGHPFLADPKAREALSLAIDRKGIAAGITRFPEAVATQLFPPALGDWHDPALPPLFYDPERAAALLAELGWEKGANGILERDGQRFEILLRTFPDRPELPLIGAALQDQFRAVGIALEVAVNNYSEIPAGHQDGSLHVALFARNYGLTPDPIGNALADFGPGGGDWGAMNWQAPAVAKALAVVASTGDRAERAHHIKTAVRGIHAGLPMIPIVWYQHTVAYAKALEGVAIDPLERSYGLSKVKWAE